MTCNHAYCRGRCVYCGKDIDGLPTQLIMDFDTDIEIVLHGIVPEGFVLATPTRRFIYSAEHDVWRAERVGDERVNAPVVAHHDGYLEGLTQSAHTMLVYGSISPEFDRAAEIVKHMYEDPDGPLVPLPSKPQPIERPFVPRKLGEY